MADAGELGRSHQVGHRLLNQSSYPSQRGLRWGWRHRPLLLAEARGHDDVQEGIQGRRRESWVGGGGGDSGGNDSSGHRV
ncbi:hypothetical protein SAY87_007622 [Trapa incisa]|uniref:Uncharacterized protein n=2 Tax=Trapa TaxID=22665 RepID=A0AAN7L5K1_TRANT|nr:hypothetical protein SAY87_007622 [Trapa incisa]KAK4776738.1 hypothetical protein SAY86_005426 [Trapa natans]